MRSQPFDIINGGRGTSRAEYQDDGDDIVTQRAVQMLLRSPSSISMTSVESHDWIEVKASEICMVGDIFYEGTNKVCETFSLEIAEMDNAYFMNYADDYKELGGTAPPHHLSMPHDVTRHSNRELIGDAEGIRPSGKQELKYDVDGGSQDVETSGQQSSDAPSSPPCIYSTDLHENSASSQVARILSTHPPPVPPRPSPEVIRRLFQNLGGQE